MYFLNLGQLLEDAGHEVAYFSMHHPRNLKTKWNKYFVSQVGFTKREGLARELAKAGRFFYSFEAKRNLKKLLHDFEPDVVHVHNVYHQLSSSVLDVLKKHPARKVMTLHDYKLICPNYKLFTQGALCERCYKRKYFQAVSHRCLQNSTPASLLAAAEMYWTKSRQIYENVIDCFVSPSQFLSKKIEHWGVKAKELKTVLNFVCLGDFTPTYETGDYYLYFGRLSPEKGLADLVAAFADLPRLKLKIVGRGPMQASLNELIKARNIENIELTGFKEKQELYNIIKKSRVVIVPTLMHDNYPFSVLEAQALGKAVIATKRGGIGEMVVPGKNGYLYEPSVENDLKSAIERAERDIEILPEFGRRARQRVEAENSPEKHLKEIMAIYSAKGE